MMAYTSACQQMLLSKMLGGRQVSEVMVPGPCGQLGVLQRQTLGQGSKLSLLQRRRPHSRTSQGVTVMAVQDAALEEDMSLQPRMVQWYPGHIAKAEKQLKEQLGGVDVVLEVRDARIPMATSHPQLPGWIGDKPHLLLLNRVDMISEEDQASWAAYFRGRGQGAFWTDAKLGTGVRRVTKAAIAAGSSINEARQRRGLLPRALKAAVVGFPNVGKSAFINRVLGRKVAPSAPRPGVTRQLRWLRIGGDVDLLDTPGVLPMSLMNQTVAQRLAVCNDIGEAAYEASLVAAAMLDSLLQLPTGPTISDIVTERYKLSPLGLSGESYIAKLAKSMYHGNEEQAGQRLLKDYRLGYLGEFCLERPPRR